MGCLLCLISRQPLSSSGEYPMAAKNLGHERCAVKAIAVMIFGRSLKWHIKPRPLTQGIEAAETKAVP